MSYVDKLQCEEACSSLCQLAKCRSQKIQEHFKKARKAIEKGDYEGFEESITEIKAEAEKPEFLAQFENREFHSPLDLFDVLDRSKQIYAMTLMAFCGVHGQRRMAELLLDKGAKIDTGCKRCGAPLLQMMLHCLVQNVEINTPMIKFFIEKGSPLDTEISVIEEDGLPLNKVEEGCPPLNKVEEDGKEIGDNGDAEDAKYNPAWQLSSLDLPLMISTANGFEVAKKVVESGKVDPITGGSPGGEKRTVVPMFMEYWFIGSNRYIRWLCKQHIPNHKRGEFVDQVVKCITAMKKNDGLTTWMYKRRTPSHAILTSGHQETITLLVQEGKEQGEDFLTETNSIGKTALHIAAENGDLESVKILLQLGADATTCDNSKLNPFMLALEKGQKAVAVFMVKTLKGDDCLGRGGETIGWALEKNLSLFFELLDPRRLVRPITGASQKTIVHMVVAAGNTEIFKIILEKLWSEEGVQQIVYGPEEGEKTALELGVEKECIDILKALEERLERHGPLNVWQSTWEEKWRSDVIPPLLNHASSCGSLTAVKHFITNGSQPTTSDAGKTPLQCASEAGHDEIVAYLLQYRAVSSDPESLKLPLLRAAANGHTKCVTLLLEKKASVLETDTAGRNCLMLAINNQHRQTALAILRDKEQGFKALKCVAIDEETTPLRLLIKEMPELAEYVLNKCIERTNGGSDEPDMGRPVQMAPTSRQKQTSVLYDFQYLDDLLPEGASKVNKKAHDSGPSLRPPKDPLSPQEPLLSEEIPLEETDGIVKRSRATAVYHYKSLKCESDSDPEGGATATPQNKLKYRSDNHILKWMTRYKRLKLLQHPLVKEYLFHKFWLFTFPLFLGYLLLYCVFLILLTSFAMVSPRPGPDSETCPVGNPNITTNGTDCTGQSGVERGFLAGAAVLVILLCCLLLFFEGLQIYQRHFTEYLSQFDNYFQVIAILVTIIFVAPGFTTDCWCAHNWQWQIGALALCLGWFNLLILLKDIPWTAIPINIFINICITFLKVLFLPFLLLMAFALPFYMVFVRTVSASEGMSVPAQVPFATPGFAIAKTMVLMIGEIDFENVFNEGDLLYNPVTYILFIIFLIIVPVLFINLLIGLAVGDTKDEKEKAEFTKIKVEVDFILEPRNFKFLRQSYKNRTSEFQKRSRYSCLARFVTRSYDEHRFTRFFARLLGMESQLYCERAKQIEERSKVIFSEIMGFSDIDAVKTTLQQESEKMLQLKEEMLQLKEDVKALQRKVRRSSW